MRSKNFTVQLKVLGLTNKGTGLATYDEVKRKLGSALEYTCRPTNDVDGHSLSRLYPPMPLVGARNRGIVGYGCWRGLGPELQAWRDISSGPLSCIAIGEPGFCSRDLIFFIVQNSMNFEKLDTYFESVLRNVVFKKVAEALAKNVWIFFPGCKHLVFCTLNDSWLS